MKKKFQPRKGIANVEFGWQDKRITVNESKPFATSDPLLIRELEAHPDIEPVKGGNS